MDGQASDQCWEDLVKLFEILQCVEHQGFLCCLPSLTLIITKIFSKQCEVARFKHHLKDRQQERWKLFRAVKLLYPVSLIQVQLLTL